MYVRGFTALPSLVLSCLFDCLSKGHGVCSHVLDQHHVHAVVLAADLLQRDVPTREGICLLSTFGAAGRPPGSHPSVLQGWVYNVVPWLCAIPLAVGGGYVSDVLINKGVNPAAPFTNMSFYDTLKKKTFPLFSCRIQRNTCEEVNAGKLARSVCERLPFK